jgi:hypothetical protein
MSLVSAQLEAQKRETRAALETLAEAEVGPGTVPYGRGGLGSPCWPPCAHGAVSALGHGQEHRQGQGWV